MEVTLYYISVVLILAMLLPLASKHLALTHDGNIEDYSPIESLSDNVKTMVYIGAVAIVVILVIVCLNKPDEMADNQMYLRRFNQGSSNAARELEPGFTTIMHLSPTFPFLIAVIALLSVSMHVFAILRNSPNVWLSFLIYLPFYFILHDMVQIRAAVAIGIMLFAFRFIVERKWYYYYAFLAVAILFHYSCTVFLVCYFVPYKRLNKWFWSALLVVATLLAATGNGIGYLSKYIPLEFIQNYLYNYVGNKQFTTSALGPSRVAKVIIAIIMLFNLDKIKEEYPLAVPVMVFYIFSLFCFLLFMDIPVLQGRMGELFGAFEIFAFAMFPLISKKHYYILFIVPIIFMIYDHMTGYALISTEFIG